MQTLFTRLALLATLPLLPVIVLQGLLVRLRLPPLRIPTDGWEGAVTLDEHEGPPIRLLVFGESTVVGVGAPTRDAAIAGQLAKHLANLARRSVLWRAMGEIGVSAEQARARLLNRLDNPRFDAAVIVLGVNDVIDLHSPARWAEDLRGLLDELRQRLGPIPLYLAAVPPVGRFPALPQPLAALLGLRAQALDETAKALVADFPDVAHVPVPIELIDGDFFCDDGIHPSPAGYKLWADHLARAIAPSFGPLPVTALRWLTESP